jgi:hypothetical protein
MRPLLLLDVDGVLNGLGVGEAPGFDRYLIGEHIDRLRECASTVRAT